MFFISFSFISGRFFLRFPQFLPPLPGINQPFRPTIRHRPSALHPFFFRSHGTSRPQQPSIPSGPNRPILAAFWASTNQKSGLSSRPVTFPHLKTLQTSFKCNMNVNLLSHFVLPFCPPPFHPFHPLTHYLSPHSTRRPHRSLFPRFVLPPLQGCVEVSRNNAPKESGIHCMRSYCLNIIHIHTP